MRCALNPPVRDPHAEPRPGRAIPVRPPGIARNTGPRARPGAHRPKLHSGDLKGATAPLLACAQRRAPPADMAHCRSRNAGGRAGLGPKQGCRLAPHPAPRGAARPARVDSLVARTADGTAGGLEASSYIATAHRVSLRCCARAGSGAAHGWRRGRAPCRTQR